MMNKNIIYIFIILGTIFISAGCVGLNVFDSAETNCDQLTETLQQNNCYLRLAYVKSFQYDVNFTEVEEPCNEISEIMTKDECFAITAKARSEIQKDGIMATNLCAMITSKQRRNLCYTEVAIIMEDSRICDNIEDIAELRNTWFGTIDQHKLCKEKVGDAVRQYTPLGPPELETEIDEETPPTPDT